MMRATYEKSLWYLLWQSKQNCSLSIRKEHRKYWWEHTAPLVGLDSQLMENVHNAYIMESEMNSKANEK